MFGINSLEQIGQIAEGWTNDLLGREQELSDKRMKICRECPLHNEATGRCDASRCINIKTGELVNAPGPGIKCGCNCFLSKKTRVPGAHCPISKW